MMGYGCNFADVIDEKDIKRFCKKEYNKFMSSLGEDYQTVLDSFASLAECGDIENYSGEILDSYKKLKKAFEKKTGLSLFIGYHDCDNDGDRYDEVDGTYWGVDGMYKMTDAGKKMRKYVSRKMWVTFG